MPLVDPHADANYFRQFGFHTPSFYQRYWKSPAYAREFSPGAQSRMVPIPGMGQGNFMPWSELYTLAHGASDAHERLRNMHPLAHALLRGGVNSG